MATANTANTNFFSIDTFRQKLNGGSKANLFRILIEPEASNTDIDLSNL
jgi:hypothetical protein